MEGADLDDLINLEGTVRGTIFSGSHKPIVAQQPEQDNVSPFAVSRHTPGVVEEVGAVKTDIDALVSTMKWQLDNPSWR